MLFVTAAETNAEHLFFQCYAWTRAIASVTEVFQAILQRLVPLLSQFNNASGLLHLTLREIAHNCFPKVIIEP